MSKELSVEQKAHDLAIAYTTYVATVRDSIIDVEPFYQEYENSYEVFLRLVKHNN